MNQMDLRKMNENSRGENILIKRANDLIVQTEHISIIINNHGASFCHRQHFFALFVTLAHRPVGVCVLLQMKSNNSYKTISNRHQTDRIDS